MRLYQATHKITGEVKIVLAKHDFGAKWLASGSKAKVKDWNCITYPTPYKVDGDKVLIRNPYTYLWEDAAIVANRNLILEYVGALVELKRKGKLRKHDFGV